ncbi:MAG TPA: hypothetical protein VHW44_31980 [Pseudonocardiaceae bacterium]|nr:hypothetical protein [Pseudonocardiaceae bacterium]
MTQPSASRPIRRRIRSLDGVPATTTPPEPERDRPLYRQRADAGPVDPVQPAGEVDGLVRPQQTKHFKLLLEQRSPPVERLAERLELDRIPSPPAHPAGAGRQ